MKMKMEIINSSYLVLSSDKQKDFDKKKHYKERKYIPGSVINEKTCNA